MKELACIILEPGMILGKDVIHKDKVLFTADTVIDNRAIEKLKRYGIMCVSIKDGEDFATTHNEKMRYNAGFQEFEKCFAECLLEYKAYMLMFIETGQKPNNQNFLGIYNKLMERVRSSALLLDYLYILVPNENELTYTHCLCSALLAGCIADWLGYDEEKKNLLIMCGFFYDIGKFKLPYEILWKPDKLTNAEYALVKSHPRVGYDMVRYVQFDEHIKNAIFMHHERMNGSGYPNHLSGDKIDEYARIMGIIDTYVAMASPRSYRSALTPMQILHTFETSLEKYDVELLMPIMRKIADAQIGTTVQLNDGSVWEIVIIHENKLSRPMLKNSDSAILDLAQNPELEIVMNL